MYMILFTCGCIFIIPVMFYYSIIPSIVTRKLSQLVPCTCIDCIIFIITDIVFITHLLL